MGLSELPYQTSNIGGAAYGCSAAALKLNFAPYMEVHCEAAPGLSPSGAKYEPCIESTGMSSTCTGIRRWLTMGEEGTVTLNTT